MVLVNSNAKRWEIIRAIRQQRGKPVDIPVPGDEIMVQRNDHQLQVFNGSTFTVAEVKKMRDLYQISTTRGDELRQTPADSPRAD